MEQITMRWIAHNKYEKSIKLMNNVEEFKLFIKSRIEPLTEAKIIALRMVDWGRLYKFYTTE